MLTAQEAAERLRISLDLVYDLIKSGQLEAHRMGRGKRAPIRIRPEAIDVFLDRSKVQPPASITPASDKPVRRRRTAATVEPLSMLKRYGFKSSRN